MMLTRTESSTLRSARPLALLGRKLVRLSVPQFSKPLTRTETESSTKKREKPPAQMLRLRSKKNESSASTK
jgi:hypothetical protein